jgi:hypothetical protein
MFRSVIVATVLALGISPLALDACFVSCHAVAPVAATAGAPACHHGASRAAGAHVQTSTSPCGHNHGPHEATMSPRGAFTDSNTGFAIRNADPLPAAATAAPGALFRNTAGSRIVNLALIASTPLRI